MMSFKNSATRWISPLIMTKLPGYGLGLLLLLLCSGADITFITAQKWIIDDCLSSLDFDNLLLYVSILFISGGLLPVFDILFTLNQHYIGYGMRVKLHKMLMEHLQRLPAKEIIGGRTARYVDNFTKDINLIGEELGYKLIRSFQSLLLTVVTGILVIRINPTIFFLSTALILIYILVGNRLAKQVKKSSREVKDISSDLLVCAEEGISATKEIITYNRLHWEWKRYMAIFHKYYKATIKNAKLDNKQVNITMSLNWLAILVTLFIGGGGAIKGTITVGGFVIVYQYVKKLCDLYGNLFYSYMKLNRTRASIDRINDVFNIQVEDKGYLVLEGPVKSISLKDIAFRYTSESRWILNDCTLDIPIGKKVAIVGASGSGKSTISKLLLKHYEPNNGQVLINDTSLTDIKDPSWISRLSMAYQDPYLYPDTITNNILLGLDKSMDEVKFICKQVLIHDFIISLPNGYSTILGERGIDISGGQKQRLALARALIRDSQILILDEATSALDLESERIIQNNIDTLRKGKTTLIIAHRLSSILNADLIYVLHKGQIVGLGTHEQLMHENAIYKTLNTSA